MRPQICIRGPVAQPTIASSTTRCSGPWPSCITTTRSSNFWGGVPPSDYFPLIQRISHKGLACARAPAFSNEQEKLPTEPLWQHGRTVENVQLTIAAVKAKRLGQRHSSSRWLTPIKLPATRAATVDSRGCQGAQIDCPRFGPAVFLAVGAAATKAFVWPGRLSAPSSCRYSTSNELRQTRCKAFSDSRCSRTQKCQDASSSVDVRPSQHLPCEWPS